MTLCIHHSVCLLLLVIVQLVTCSCQDNEESCRTVWPDLVGETGDNAKGQILGDNPSLDVTIVPYGHMVTTDYRTDRVRIYVDKNNIVTKPPKIG
ncbi:subtilisin inhibitor CLSI-I-like [Anneissia japonica]|uniref:subtilisin inhibitor CLSI-I-like n=1 Tax=Anneissia japonica TaxID=1529436 RepID=UPI00142558B8|nr:subtilisin inhibitor CLSI-I-like [Anneissia japonica]